MPTVPDPPHPESGPGPADPAPEGGGAAPHTFTVAEANRLLPHLRTALAEARDHVREIRACDRELRRMEAVGKGPGGGWILAGDHRAASARLAEHRSACDGLLRRLAAKGCQVKDLDAGICDFPARIGGKDILLCWRLDEPSVAHYHGRLEGFRGRRTIPPGTP